MQNLLKAIGEYIPLSEADVRIITDLFETSYLEKGETFKLPNAVCTRLAFINCGLMRHYAEKDGNEKTIYFSSENDFVCDFDSFLSQKPTAKGITALEPTSIISITKENLERFYDTVKFGDRFGRKLIENEFPKTVNHIVSVHTDTAVDRYERFLSLFLHIAQRIPQYYVASFIGVTPSPLSRIRKNDL